MVSAEAAPGGTLSGALASVTGSVRDLQRKLASALGGKDIPGFSAPDTLTQAYADAQATQQALLDGGLGERKRKERDDLELVKAWSLPPGASLIDSDVAPFLAYNEEHFRDLNGADVVNLVPPGGETTTHATTDDSDYRVPALGRYYVLEWEEEDAREAKRQSAEHARRLAREEYLKLNPPKKEKPAAKAKPKHKKRPRDDTQIQVQPVAPLDKPEETPDKCHVCWEGAAYDDNQILYCEGCDVAVHQDCYGVKQVPKGDWYCSPCVEGGLGSNTQGKAKAKPKGKGKGGKTSKNALKKKYCVVCDVEGGALKPVAGGKDRWCHVFCANWLPETFVVDWKTMEPIGGVDDIDRERASLRCEVCAKPKGTGACIQCDFGQCSAAYHPLCAALSGNRCMEIQSDMQKDGCVYKSFCLKHSKARLKKTQEKKTSGDAEDDELETDDLDKETDSEDDDEPASKKEKCGKNANASVATPEPSTSRRSARAGRCESATPPPNAGDVEDDEVMESVGKDKENHLIDRMDTKQRGVDGCVGVTTSGQAAVETVVEETLFEHTARALLAPPPAMPTEPESSKPEEEKKPVPNTNQTSGKTNKCSVCVAHKKGVCGTSTAPNRCYRRREKSASAGQLVGLDTAGGGGSGVSSFADGENGSADTSVPGETGPPAASMEETLLGLEKAADLINMAPDDEIVGELLQAHAALAKTQWVTRTLAAKALSNAFDASATEEERRAEQLRWGEDTDRYETRWRGGRWREEWLKKRGMPSADQTFGVDAGAGDDPFKDCTKELVDPLVETGAMEDALCAVCGGGESEEPNEIVFCERCELATHQDCYGVTEVPEGDWLCWPCHVAETNETTQDQPPSRPPRWLREPGDGSLYDPRPVCCLCPVRRGALRAVVEPAKPPTVVPGVTTDDVARADDETATAKNETSSEKKPAQKRRAALCGFLEPEVVVAVCAELRVEAAVPGSGAGKTAPAESAAPGVPSVDPTTEHTASANAPRKGSDDPLGQQTMSDAHTAVVHESMTQGTAAHTAIVESTTMTQGSEKPEITRWAHVVCAQCVPGVEFAPSCAPGVAGAVIRGLDKIPTWAFQDTCELCQRLEGVTTKCGWPGCAVRVHPLCARRQGWLLSEITKQSDDRFVFCGKHSAAERRRIENGLPGVAERSAGGGRGGRGGRGLLTTKGRGGRGGRGPNRRRPVPSRVEMELLKRARFGLEKLRALCERTLIEQKQKRQLVEANAELWTMQLAGLDDGLGAATPPSPPPSPRRTETWMTAARLTAANAALPNGFAFQKMPHGEHSEAVTFKEYTAMNTAEP